MEIRVSLDSEFIERIEEIKNYYGIKNNTEMIRFLITEKHREIREKV